MSRYRLWIAAVLLGVVMGTTGALAAEIFWPDWCDSLPAWMAELAGCYRCSSGDCSGAR